MSPYEFPVEAGQIMLFARAVGDPNPVYRDPAAAKDTEVGGIIAPPTFVAAAAHYDPSYPLRPKAGEPWFGSASKATGLTEPVKGGAAMHGEQHYTYHRPLRPGDVVTVTPTRGESWEKTSRSGGTLYLYEMITEYRDTQGELVVTARAVVVSPERPAEESA